MRPTQYFKCLADDTRLKILLLLLSRSELCVCDLTLALDESQPKVSRHLAELKKHALVSDERRGKWIYYRLNAALAPWQQAVIDLALANHPEFIEAESRLLAEQLNDGCC